MIDPSDAGWMELALEAARQARAEDEVPVGAVLVVGDRLIASGHNVRERRRDPTAHAEIVALRRAARTLGRWRLDDATLFVTLEPCAMCAGAIVNARIARLVYGAEDPRAGAVRSLYAIADDHRLNHRVPITSGVLADRSAELLREYFRSKRPSSAAERYAIRRAHPGDEAGIARVSISARRAAWAGRLPEDAFEALGRSARRSDWERILTDEASMVLVATREPSGAIVAFLWGSTNEDGPPEIPGAVRELRVLRELERRGLGRRLVEAALPWFEARSLAPIIAWAPAADRTSSAFYAALGAAVPSNAEGALRTRVVRFGGTEVMEVGYVIAGHS